MYQNIDGHATWYVAPQRQRTRPFGKCKMFISCKKWLACQRANNAALCRQVAYLFSGDGGTYLNGIGWVVELWSGTDFRGLPKAKFASAMRLSSQIPYGWASTIQPPKPLPRFRLRQFHSADTLLYHIGADLLDVRTFFRSPFQSLESEAKCLSRGHQWAWGEILELDFQAFASVDRQVTIVDFQSHNAEAGHVETTADSTVRIGQIPASLHVAIFARLLRSN